MRSKVWLLWHDWQKLIAVDEDKAEQAKAGHRLGVVVVRLTCLMVGQAGHMDMQQAYALHKDKDGGLLYAVGRQLMLA